MKYIRPQERSNGYKKFEIGTHAATIKKVSKKVSKSGSDMFVLSLEGTNEEKGNYFFVFGNDYTESNMSYLLSSIEDNGVEMPDIDFGYNKNTFDFLANKDVYIQVEEKLYQGNMQAQITTFLTLEEFETSDQFNENEEDAKSDW